MNIGDMNPPPPKRWKGKDPQTSIAPPAASGENPFANVFLQGPPAASFPSSTGFSTNSASTSSNIDDLKRLRDERLKRLDDQFYAKDKTLFSQGITSHIGVDVRAWRDYRHAINRDFEQNKTTSTPAASRVSFGSTT
jgi:hypothetical protein